MSTLDRTVRMRDPFDAATTDLAKTLFIFRSDAKRQFNTLLKTSDGRRLVAGALAKFLLATDQNDPDQDYQVELVARWLADKDASDIIGNVAQVPDVANSAQFSSLVKSYSTTRAVHAD